MTVFITGPGRSGTSFLMQLLTRLGMDTGFEPYKELFVDDLRAGCEWDITVDDDFDKAPRFIKGPVWAYMLKYMLTNNTTQIDHVVMPLRDLTESAESRLDVGLEFMVDKEYVKMPGQHLMEVQENVLAMLTGKVLEACYLYRIPLTLMRFPRLVEDDAYCWLKVSEFADVDYDDFREKWTELVK
ncbi:MAG: hypothetical protein GWN77_09675 [Gammaproteobacteria bacterium]|nr:hypothetical protein [Gammaproteobacteria bacterium]